MEKGGVSKAEPFQAHPAIPAISQWTEQALRQCDQKNHPLDPLWISWPYLPPFSLRKPS